ncbi:MAG: hypothetical protein HZC41_00620 [Chloroflexi bacterium]|nr:hypothetical protein [Chloroflexota bacterium]
MSTSLPGYFEIYRDVINKSGFKTGFKLIGGGTGFGKTRGISELIRQNSTDRKIIYCSHRKQLIENMKREIGDPDRYIVLPSNAEAVYNALQVPSPTLEEVIHNEQIFKWAGSDPQKQKGVLRALRQLRRLIEKYGEKAVKQFQDEAHHEANEVIKYVRAALKAKAKEETKSKKQNTSVRYERSKSSKQGKSANKDNWLDHAVVYALFPFIQFQRTDKQVLLTTVQKGFDSFFDGKRSTNLTRLRGGDGYIILLDEFDFLEEELLGIICKTPLVDDPFMFVELFYQEMTRHKMLHEEYATEEIRARIKNDIIPLIARIADYGINYPTINQFTTHLEKKKPRPAIFSTSVTHLNQQLYLKQGQRSFEIYDSPKPDSVDAVRVFEFIYQATQEILILLLELRENDTTTYYEMLQQCYGKTDFYQQVERIHEVGRRTSEKAHHIPLDVLFDEGYGVYEINHIGYRSDKDEAEFRYYAIFNTPERMLRDLVKHNLVFALSATADIPRVVKHFDLAWFERQDGVNVIPSSPSEEKIIRDLSHTKNEKRASSITVERLPELDPGNRLHLQIKTLAEQVAKNNPDGKDDETTLFHRQQRAEMFYRVLLWAFSDPDRETEIKTHLVFVNSFREIRESFETLNDVIRIEKIRENNSLNVYEIRNFQNPQETIAVAILYNAEAARALNDPVTMQIYKEQFWKGLPVFVVTQYSSAGNGVNLQYLPTPESHEGDEVDFSCLHLLEAPYYFFNGWDNERNDAENIAALKQDIWHCAKLYMSHHFSRNEFLYILSDLRDAGINYRYHRNKNTRFDLICNQVAALIQALGRIERVWKPMQAQTLMLSEDVFQIFQAYCTRPEFASVREAREAFLSANLRAVQERITQMAQYQDEQSQKYINTQLSRAQKLSIEAVNGLLRRLERLRAGHDDTMARADWTELRKAMLRHDFAAKVIQRYCGTCSTSHYQDGIIWVDKNLATYPPNKWPTDAQKWDFNFIYRTVKQNTLIRRRFEEQGYPLQFPSHLERIPTRYFYQAILIGAIGEEAIQALLEEHVELGKIDDIMFEIADLKIASSPWYMDCKNYGEITLDTFSFDDDDDLREPHPKLNSDAFLKTAQHKIDVLQAFHQSDNVKLIYLNLFSYKSRRPNYLTQSLDRVNTFEEAQIIILPSVLDTDDPARLHRDFSALLNEIERWS